MTAWHPPNTLILILGNIEQLQSTLLLGEPPDQNCSKRQINVVRKPMRHTLSSVSVEIGRLEGSLDLVQDAQLLCHVQTLRIR
jgi:hypothetical protein